MNIKGVSNHMNLMPLAEKASLSTSSSVKHCTTDLEAESRLATEFAIEMMNSFKLTWLFAALLPLRLLSASTCRVAFSLSCPTTNKTNVENVLSSSFWVGVGLDSMTSVTRRGLKALFSGSLYALTNTCKILPGAYSLGQVSYERSRISHDTDFYFGFQR